MQILIAPGAFKNSLSANAVATGLARGIGQSGFEAKITLLPIADGGNGTLDAFLARGGERRSVKVDDPLGRPINVEYGLIFDSENVGESSGIAIIEMALASGLELLSGDELNPLKASTFGTGQLMQAALEAGARRFIVGMGGSATVDGGAGCAQALGVRFLDVDGQDIERGGGALAQVASVDASGLDPRWRDAEVIIASDVENPTLGETGAAAVFGPQKGASPAQVDLLEAALTHFFTVVNDQTGVDVRDAVGGGAAGALSAGLMAFVGGKIESGIDLLLRHHNFEALLARTDVVITGEGQMDSQTIYGKGPVGVARLAKSYGVPTLAVVGGLNVDEALLHEAGIQAVFPIVNRPMTLEMAINNAAELVEQTGRRIGYLLELTQMMRD
ncbi:MAG: glycerate kinase [Aggregatilineales bacterium]